MKSVVEVRRKEGESGESVVRRFTRKVQQSGLLLRAKRRRFYEPVQTKRQIKEDAIRRKGVKDKREYLKRIGKLEEWMERQGYRSYKGSKK
ncbi:MAG: 30S ribosomal protein S21 [bacterium]|nr:30S ribosomal protein S21 [bacterium]